MPFLKQNKTRRQNKEPREALDELPRSVERAGEEEQDSVQPESGRGLNH